MGSIVENVLQNLTNTQSNTAKAQKDLTDMGNYMSYGLGREDSNASGWYNKKGYFRRALSMINGALSLKSFMENSGL